MVETGAWGPSLIWPLGTSLEPAVLPAEDGQSPGRGLHVGSATEEGRCISETLTPSFPHEPVSATLSHLHVTASRKGEWWRASGGGELVGGHVTRGPKDNSSHFVSCSRYDVISDPLVSEEHWSPLCLCPSVYFML